MRQTFITLLAMLGCALPTMVWASGDIGGVQGGGFHSALPGYEQLQFGDLKTTIQRSVIQIPSDYGKLVQIVPAKGSSILWFESDNGILRNVIVDNNALWAIQRSGVMGSEK